MPDDKQKQLPPDDDREKHPPTLHDFDAEVFSVGTWNGDNYTGDDLDAMVAAFAQLGASIKPPIKLGHNEQQMKDIMKDGHPAIGWVKALKRVGDKLVASLTQVPDIVYKAIKAGRYKRVSSEIYWNLKHGGQTFKRVLAGVALLGADIPAVTNLKDLEAYLSQSTETGSFEKCAAYAFSFDESGTITSRKEDNMSDELKQYQEKLAATEAALKKAEAEAKEYKEKHEAEARTRIEKDKESKWEAFKAFCEDMVKAGRMLPASRDILTAKDKYSYSEETGDFSITLETIKAYVETHAKVLNTDEVAKHDKNDDGDHKDVFEEVDSKAKKYAADKKVTYGEAMAVVLADDKDLADRYINATERGAEGDE